MIITVEVKNEILGDSVFWEGPDTHLHEVKNEVAKGLAHMTRLDGQPHKRGMWITSAKEEPVLEDSCQPDFDVEFEPNKFFVVKRKWLLDNLKPNEVDLFVKVMLAAPRHQYFICNQDEPYAEEVLATILRGEGKKNG